MTKYDFIPPIVFKLKNRLYKPVPSAAHQAVEEILSDKHGYEDEEVANVVADKTVAFRNGDAGLITPTSLFLLAGLNYVRNEYNPLRVLDFGGACGIHYYEMKKYLPATRFQWTVVETKVMVEAARSAGLENEELSFKADLNEAGPVDFAYSSGTFQMLANPYEYLTTFLIHTPKYVMLNRMSFNEAGEDIQSIHKSMLSDNGVGKMPDKYTDRKVWYPYNAMALNKFEGMMKDYYRLWDFNETSGALELPGARIIGRGRLYVRNN